jgi:hypothetical protein
MRQELTRVWGVPPQPSAAPARQERIGAAWRCAAEVERQHHHRRAFAQTTHAVNAPATDSRLGRAAPAARCARAPGKNRRGLARPAAAWCGAAEVERQQHHRRAPGSPTQAATAPSAAATGRRAAAGRPRRARPGTWRVSRRGGSPGPHRRRRPHDRPTRAARPPPSRPTGGTVVRSILPRTFFTSQELIPPARTRTSTSPG